MLPGGRQQARGPFCFLKYPPQKKKTYPSKKKYNVSHPALLGSIERRPRSEVLWTALGSRKRRRSVFVVGHPHEELQADALPRIREAEPPALHYACFNSKLERILF